MIKEQHAVGHFPGKPHFVGHANHGHAFKRQGFHHVQHFTDHLRVERGGRLVEQHDLGFHRQRAGNGHSLLLSTREARRIFIGFLPDTDLFQQGTGLGFALGLAALAHDFLRQAQVLKHGHVREQVEMLEHHADFTTVGVHVRFRVGEVDPVDADRARIEIFQAIQTPQKRRLARPGRANHHQHFALGDRGADVIHRANNLPAGVEDFYQFADFNHFARASAQDGWPGWTAAG